MPQQGLHHAQVSAAFQQVGGEGVAQDVGADAGRVDTGRDRRLIQKLGEAARGEMAALAVRGEQPGAVGRVRLSGGVAGVQPGLDRLARGHVQRGQPLLAALAAHDQIGGVAANGLDLERQQLGYAQA